MISLLAATLICISVPGDTECGKASDVLATVKIHGRLCRLPADRKPHGTACKAWVYPQRVVMR